MVDSRCGLHCTGCEYKETCGCGGCIETNGHPFHGECPVAVCCQDKGIVPYIAVNAQTSLVSF